MIYFPENEGDGGGLEGKSVNEGAEYSCLI